MFLNYAALVSSSINSPASSTGSTIDTQLWSRVQLQGSASSVAFTSSFQITDIESVNAIPNPNSWQTLTTLLVPANTVQTSSILPINSKYARILTSVTSGSSGSVAVYASFSDRSTDGIDASAIETGQLDYERNSAALVDLYTVTVANSTASIDPMNGAAQFVAITGSSLLSASFSAVPSGKSATTSVYITSSAVTMSFGGVNLWSGGNPGNVTTAGNYLLVLSNYLSASTNRVIGSLQLLS